MILVVLPENLQKTLRDINLKKYKVYGLDLSKEMIKFAMKNNKSKNLIFKNEDINNFKFEKSSLIISFYTIQFLKYEKDQN